MRKCITEKLIIKTEMHHLHLLFIDFSISLPSKKRRILLYGFSAFEMQVDGGRDANERRQQGDDRGELPNACADAKRRGEFCDSYDK